MSAASDKFMALEAVITAIMLQKNTSTVPSWDEIAAQLRTEAKDTPCAAFGRKCPALSTWAKALFQAHDLPRCWTLLARLVRATLSTDLSARMWTRLLHAAAVVDAGALTLAILEKTPAPPLHWNDTNDGMHIRSAARVDYTIYAETRELKQSDEDTAFAVLARGMHGTPRWIAVENVLALRYMLTHFPTIDTLVFRQMYRDAIYCARISMLEEFARHPKLQPACEEFASNFDALTRTHAYFEYKCNGTGLAWYISKYGTEQVLQIFVTANWHVPKSAEYWRVLGPAFAHVCVSKALSVFSFANLCLAQAISYRWPLVLDLVKHWTVPEIAAYMRATEDAADVLYEYAITANHAATIDHVRAAIFASGKNVCKSLFTGDPAQFLPHLRTFYGNALPEHVLLHMLLIESHCYFSESLFDQLSDDMLTEMLQRAHLPSLSLAAVKYLKRRGIAFQAIHVTNTWNHIFSPFQGQLDGLRQTVFPMSNNNSAVGHVISAYADAGLPPCCSALLHLLLIHADMCKHSHFQYICPVTRQFCDLCSTINVQAQLVPFQNIFSTIVTNIHAIGPTFDCLMECIFDRLGLRLAEPWAIFDDAFKTHNSTVHVGIAKAVKYYHESPKRIKTV